MLTIKYAELTESDKEKVKGLLMGDGTIAGGNASPNANCFFAVRMINRRFLEHVNEELNHLTTNLRKSKTAEQALEQGNKSLEREVKSAKPYYELKFSRHPYFSKLRSKWYSKEGKKFPEQRLTPEKLKMWYVCDGSYTRKRARIAASNEEERLDKLVEMFREQSLNPSTNNKDIYFSVEETKNFFNYIGQPVAGFNHKWPEDI